jgi:hypothetical protein
MAMVKGDKACTSGLSKDIWDIMSGTGYPGEQVTDEKAEDYKARTDSMKAMCNAIASAVIQHMKDNAEIKNVATNVTTTVAPGIVALCPPPTGAGATTGPGSGSGSGTQTGSGTII